MEQQIEQFTVQGMTGVDIALNIAGPGSRSYAFIIDWHIRVLVALAWMMAAMLIFNGGLSWRPDTGGSAVWVGLLIGLPSSIIYFLYHPILELLMHGQTPGKRMAGVRVVNREGGVPSTGAILIRNMFRLIDSLPVFYLVGLFTTFVTEQRVRIGDLAAGTLLVMDESAASKSLERFRASDAQRLDPNTLDLIEQILERWKSLDVEKRAAIARSLLQRIDANPPRALFDMNDEELHARLMALVNR